MREGRRGHALLFQTLAVFRFVSLAMGVGLVFTFPEPAERVDLLLVAWVAMVGLYSVARILWPTPLGLPVGWRGWALVLPDLALAVGLVLLTGGLDSPFLIYSLTPVLTASLLLDRRTAFTLAGLTALPTVAAHLIPLLGFTAFPWVLQGNYLAFALLFSVVCLLTAYLPFLTNLNWNLRLRQESAERERQALLREVHDHVAQVLAFLSLKVKRAEEKASPGGLAAEEVREVARAVEQAYLRVRDFLDRRPGAGEGEGLEHQVRRMAQRWSRDTGVPVQVQVQGEMPPLPREHTYHLLQILGEALANAGKHALATRVWVSVDRSPQGLVLCVRDNGRGFPPGQPRGHGLGIMEERARLIGAALTICSTPGKGTEVVVTYPSPEGR